MFIEALLCGPFRVPLVPILRYTKIRALKSVKQESDYYELKYILSKLKYEKSSRYFG